MDINDLSGGELYEGFLFHMGRDLLQSSSAARSGYYWELSICHLMHVNFGDTDV